MLVKVNPRMLDMAKEQNLFPEVERTVVALIANTPSTGEAFQAYEKYGALVPDWKFMFASEKGATPGLAVNRAFSDGSVVRGLFASERVLLLDPSVREAMLTAGQASFPIDYSISLDTQALSYLAPYLDDKTSKLPRDFHEIFAFIAQENVFVDPIPYLAENLPNVLIEKNIPGIRRRLAAYEILRTIDGKHFHENQEVRSTLSDDERDGNVNRLIEKMLADASDPELRSSVLHRHNLAYCTLLKMATIQLRSRAKTKEEKIHELVEFMDTGLKAIFVREIVVAAKYFEEGQNFAFFGKIQRAPSDQVPELIKQLKNMAWDFCHIRYIEEAATNSETLPETALVQARFFFPALLTCDKRFVEVIDLYALKSCAYRHEPWIQMPFPAIDWIAVAAGLPDAQAAFIERFYSRHTLHRREAQRESVEANLPAIVCNLEEEFAAAVGQRR